MGLFDFFSDDTFKDKKGYKRFNDTRTPVHRKEAENKLGRKLKPGEVVHHINRDKTNNSPDNLYVFRNQSQHDKAHKIDALRFGKNYSYKGAEKKKKGFWDMF